MVITHTVAAVGDGWVYHFIYQAFVLAFDLLILILQNLSKTLYPLPLLHFTPASWPEIGTHWKNSQRPEILSAAKAISVSTLFLSAACIYF